MAGRRPPASAGRPSRGQPELPPPLVVKEPPKAKSGLVEKGLAWQETFDFGKGGAQAFKLPAVGLLAAPPASSLQRTREELEANASPSSGSSTTSASTATSCRRARGPSSPPTSSSRRRASR